MTFDLPRRMFSEGLGTAILVCSIVGSGIMSAGLTEDMAVALLANAAVTGGVLAVVITVLGPVSGSHINPMVSLAFLLQRKLSLRDFCAYVPSQICGGILGAVAANAMFSTALLQAPTALRTGGALWLSETLATFGLIGVILAGVQFCITAVPWLVGVYIATAIWFTSSSSFANPAAAIGRSLSDTYIGIRPVDLPAYFVAHVLGTLLAVAIFGWLLRPAEKGRATAP